MITVRFFYTKKQVSGFELAGHAGSGEYGKDIVCAGVSALAISTVNGLQKLAKAELEIHTDEKAGGYMKVKSAGKDDETEAAVLLFANFKLGIKEIALSYPKYIKIS
ncbi:ribosomal-processing cysteine protease Prp [Liquorilactobacillus oeni]|uniref:Ribosomal processing cysteine protease Prp n=1 Tax=Liquorilactobacillus oeni DSM 19972 TaxID=1423777 RepID=A0A0R1M829_9LACO|nr:ribosomal-processing cysteine protease Prp [Liquorilactobacillus oeni]KRL04246.1 hypothetical protein FD46_GL001370 [Liquorilactobacillus oeni DSM 19972]